MRFGETHFTRHEAGPREADTFWCHGSRVTDAPGCRESMAGEETDAVFDIAESFGRLSLAAPFDFTGIDVDGPERNRSRIDLLAAGKARAPVQHFP